MPIAIEGALLRLRFPIDDTAFAREAAVAAPDWTSDWSAEGFSFDAVDAVEIAVLTSFWACPDTVCSRPARSSRPRSTLPQKPLRVVAKAAPVGLPNADSAGLWAGW